MIAPLVGDEGPPKSEAWTKSHVHSSAFPDSPRQAGRLQPSCCKWGMRFPGQGPTSPHTEAQCYSLWEEALLTGLRLTS